MASKSELNERVADAYEHLYDLVYLRTHPLTELLVPDPDLERKDRAWQLHRILLQAIDDLNPGPQAPAFSHEWRRHRLMVLRYVDGLDPLTVATRLAISRRQYYREHEAAIEAVVAILWDRCQAQGSTGAPPVQTALPVDGDSDHLALLRLEAARMAQTSRYAHLGDVVQGVASLLQERLQQRQMGLDVTLPSALPGIPLDRGLLRQMLLGMLGYLVERSSQATIRLQAQAEATSLHLSLRVEPPSAVSPAPLPVAQERVSTLNDLAALSAATIQPLQAQGCIVGFDVQLPAGRQRTVLVVDDNDDVLALFQRYLSLHQYLVATAKDCPQALALARRLQPHAITLDLMMPGQDGWEILQTLLNQPETRGIPIVVCSVLRERELALSLGASAFLEKPVTEQALLAVLQALG